MTLEFLPTTQLAQNTTGQFRRSAIMAIMMMLIALAAPSGLLYAQVAGTGTIEGTIADPSGAVVPGAMVTATNEGTGLKSSQKTSGSGSYTLSALPPGEYDVDVQAAGFAPYTQEHVILNALTQLGLNISLRAGSETQKVVVTAQAPELQTENGQNEGSGAYLVILPARKDLAVE